MGRKLRVVMLTGVLVIGVTLTVSRCGSSSSDSTTKASVKAMKF